MKPGNTRQLTVMHVWILWNSATVIPFGAIARADTTCLAHQKSQKDGQEQRRHNDVGDKGPREVPDQE